MPRPGEPYIPSIAWPSQLQLHSPWRGCIGAPWFVGYDPPRTLAPADGIVPTITLDPTPDSAQTLERAHRTNGDGRTAAPAAKPKPDQPAITMSAKVPSFLTMLDPQADPDAASWGSDIQATQSRLQSANPASQIQDPDDTLTRKGRLRGFYAQGSHSKNGADGGTIDPNLVWTKGRSLDTHSGGIQSLSTAKQQIDPDSGNRVNQQSESLRDPKSKQRQATPEEMFPKQSNSAVATLDPPVKPSITYSPNDLGPSKPNVIEIDDLALTFTSVPLSPMPIEPISTIIAVKTVTAIPGEVLVDNKTLLPGGTAFIVDGTRISVNTQGDVIVGVHTASASQIRAVIPETGAKSASVPSGSQPAKA